MVKEKDGHIVGKVAYVAQSGARGLKIEGSEDWYNPVKTILDSITPDKYKGKMVDLKLREPGSNQFERITVLENAEEIKVKEEKIQTKEEVKEEEVQTPVKEKESPAEATGEAQEDTEEPTKHLMHAFEDFIAQNSLTQEEVEKLLKTQLETAKKGPQNLTYVSWAEAWAKLKAIHPNAQYKVYENKEGMPYFSDESGAFVKVSVKIKGLSHTIHLPVMDYNNKAVKKPALEAMGINKAIQRALAKAIAMHGLGIYVYQGEDYPSKEDTNDDKD